MDVKHPENIDPRPKRRKDRDNPYTIFSTGTGSDEPHYYLSFRDGRKQLFNFTTIKNRTGFLAVCYNSSHHAGAVFGFL